MLCLGCRKDDLREFFFRCLEHAKHCNNNKTQNTWVHFCLMNNLYNTYLWWYSIKQPFYYAQPIMISNKSRQKDVCPKMQRKKTFFGWNFFPNHLMDILIFWIFFQDHGNKYELTLTSSKIYFLCALVIMHFGQFHLLTNAIHCP